MICNIRLVSKPKSKSFQLVSGHMVVSENVWSVREMHFSGRSEMLRFNNMIRMGDVVNRMSFACTL